MAQVQQAPASDVTNSIPDSNGSSSPGGGSTATMVKTRPAPPKVNRMPPWNVLLHNDAVNEIGYVVETVIELVKVNPRQALFQTLEAHKCGIALLLTTHREHAELLAEQFMSKRLTVTIEPDR